MRLQNDQGLGVDPLRRPVERERSAIVDATLVLEPLIRQAEEIPSSLTDLGDATPAPHIPADQERTTRVLAQQLPVS
jgi:hypothetical protein